MSLAGKHEYRQRSFCCFILQNIHEESELGEIISERIGMTEVFKEWLRHLGKDRHRRKITMYLSDTNKPDSELRAHLLQE